MCLKSHCLSQGERMHPSWQWMRSNCFSSAIFNALLRKISEVSFPWTIGWECSVHTVEIMDGLLEDKRSYDCIVKHQLRIISVLLICYWVSLYLEIYYIVGIIWRTKLQCSAEIHCIAVIMWIRKNKCRKNIFKKFASRRREINIPYLYPGKFTYP